MEILGSLATWVFWAYYSAGLLIMGMALTAYLGATDVTAPAPWLVVVAAYCGAAGALIGGIQAGPHAIATAAMGVMVVRFLWVTGITLGIVASVMYLWSIRKQE